MRPCLPQNGHSVGLCDRSSHHGAPAAPRFLPRMLLFAVILGAHRCAAQSASPTSTPIVPLVYPPAALNGPSVTLSGQTYGNGLYVASASSDNTWSGWRAFDFCCSGLSFSGWTSAANNYNAASGAYVGAVSTSLTNGTVYSGEWVQLLLPVAVQLSFYTIRPQSNCNPTCTSAPSLSSLFPSLVMCLHSTFLLAWVGVLFRVCLNMAFFCACECSCLCLPPLHTGRHWPQPNEFCRAGKQ